MVRGSVGTDLLWVSGGYPVQKMISDEAPKDGDLRHHHVRSTPVGGVHAVVT